MQLVSGRRILSATDLNNYLACEHLTSLDLAAMGGSLERPSERSGQAELLSKLGEEHEANYLQRLIAAGLKVATIERGRGLDAIHAAAAETEAAMARGDEVIYQATFFDDGWLGYADFLRKVDVPRPGGRWDWHYEVEDTKLARHVAPYFLLQLAYYSEHVTRIQGCAPETMRVVLGNGEIESYRVEDHAAYYRAVRERFLAWLDGGSSNSYPSPVKHCGLCVWENHCESQWKKDDHLSLVANITRRQVQRLNDAGITTLAGLANAPVDRKPDTMERTTFETLERQARLQEEQRIATARGDEYPYRREFLRKGFDPPQGLHRIPERSDGDVFFDMEGDPYYDIGTGLEYLFGATTADRTFHAFWGCDRTAGPFRDRRAEKLAFERFIDFVCERRAAFPGMHIYHYAPYEKTALQKLSQRHATREAEVDVILREEWLVDLYGVVRQAIAVGQSGYSIKKIEEFYGKRGNESGVKAGDESILRFEEWVALRGDAEKRDDGVLDDLERYNRYDCDSTLDLRDWLLTLRAEASQQFGIEFPPYTGKEVEVAKPDEKNVELKAALDARIPEDFDPEEHDAGMEAVRPFFLARHMLEYHWREHKPVYWRFHDRCETHGEDGRALIDDAECLLDLEVIDGPKPVGRGSSQYEFRFPAQLHKIGNDHCFDLGSKDKAGEIISIEDGEEFGRLILKRGPSLNNLPLPNAIVVRKIIQPTTVLDAIVRFSDALLAGEPFRYRAAFDVLTAAAPRLRDRAAGARIQPEHADLASVRALCDALDESYLFVQGPPGAGKTYLGARLIVDLMVAGKRVGITANSHKAIHNLLDEVEAAAAERAVDFRGLKKCSKGDESTEYRSAHIDCVDGPLAADGVNLVAGTAWAFGPVAMDQQLDYLFIDEAGQVALPHAIAVMTSAKNTIMLGDPLQLAQVGLTAHPGDIGASVLEHLLGHELRPVAPDRGILLTDSYRMHPDVCSFISELLYEGKLRSADGREQQDVRSPALNGTGLRYLPVEHTGNSQRSDEEAERIAVEIEGLLRGSVRDIKGVARPLEAADIMVVTPYNAQVSCIRKALGARGLTDVEVGTVDRFQGREAFVVFFSTAASSPDDAPRGVSFVFDRQRFNVAISRARALAVMVGSPSLLIQRCTSVEDALVANGVCRFIEQSRRQPLTA